MVKLLLSIVHFFKRLLPKTSTKIRRCSKHYACICDLDITGGNWGSFLDCHGIGMSVILDIILERQNLNSQNDMGKQTKTIFMVWSQKKNPYSKCGSGSDSLNTAINYLYLLSEIVSIWLFLRRSYEELTTCEF